MFILLILTTLINLYLFYNLNKNKSSLEKIFSIFILTNIVWTMFNYLLFHSNNTFFAIILTKLVMIPSSFLPILLYLFAKNINKEKEGFPKIKNNIYILIVFIFEIFFLSNYLVNSVQLHPFLIRFGYGIYVYIFFILFFSSLFTIYLYKKFKDSLGYNKIILEYFLTGFIVTAIFAIISNLILPSFFNIYSLTTIGTLSPIFVNILVYYALTRSRIADLKKIIRNI